MPLTFEDVSAAYQKAMMDKDSGPLSEILDDDFKWDLIARKDGASANKMQTIMWNLKTTMTQSNYKTIYNGKDLVIGTFNISAEGEDDSIVLSIGHLNEDGTKVIRCQHLSGPYTEGMKGMMKMGFLL